MTRFYPKRFRAEYAQPMEVVFREQCQEALEGGKLAFLRLWIEALIDFCKSVTREHLSELGTNMNRIKAHLFAKPDLTFRKLFITLAVTAFAIMAIGNAFLPRIYMSVARVEIQRPNPDAAYDPYFMHTEFEKVVSRPVLEEVVRDFSLEKTFAQRIGTRPAREESCRLLRNMISLRQSRNTALLELRVANEDPHLAAALANAIVETYTRNNRASESPARVHFIDPAAPGMRPVRPNIALNLALGLLLTLPIAALGAFLLRRAFRKVSPPVAIA